MAENYEYEITANRTERGWEIHPHGLRRAADLCQNAGATALIVRDSSGRPTLRVLWAGADREELHAP